ncbi:Transposase, partial [Phytophthora megakarya]
FFGWGYVDGTFTRISFHEVFKTKILPFLNPSLLPRAIVVIDNAKIDLYKELQDMIHETGALLFSCLHIHPILML